MDLERAAKQASQAGAQMEQPLGGGQCDALAAREKRFGECGLEEKVERLHRLCTALININNRMAERLEEAHHTAHAHMHDGFGRIGVPPRDSFQNYPLNAVRISDHGIR